MRELKPFNFQAWIEAHREQLQPPVCNKQVFEDSEFIIMVVGGPNSRKDYHYDPGEEFFYQLEGDMLLKTIQDGRRVDIPIREGEVFLLPPEMPHSPQRFSDTVGLVVERPRVAGERDGFMWYCDDCDALLYEHYLQLENIETQLAPIFETFYADEALRTCGQCGAVMPAPKAAQNS